MDSKPIIIEPIGQNLGDALAMGLGIQYAMKEQADERDKVLVEHGTGNVPAVEKEVPVAACHKDDGVEAEKESKKIKAYNKLIMSSKPKREYRFHPLDVKTAKKSPMEIWHNKFKVKFHPETCSPAFLRKYRDIPEAEQKRKIEKVHSDLDKLARIREAVGIKEEDENKECDGCELVAVIREILNR